MYIFYYTPIWPVPTQHHNPLQCPNSLQNMSLPQICPVTPKQSEDGQEVEAQIYRTYRKVFQDQLERLLKKRRKKLWSEKEDQILLKVQDSVLGWQKISNLIPNSNPEICRRRYNKIIQTSKKWPKCIDQEIKRLCTQGKPQWSTIANAINEKFQHRYTYTGKMIKERYQFYIRQGIFNLQWTVEEDLKLLDQIRKHGKSWKTIVMNFEGRTELQLKNRFNGTLKLVEKRVLAKVKEVLDQI